MDLVTLDALLMPCFLNAVAGGAVFRLGQRSDSAALRFRRVQQGGTSDAGYPYPRFMRIGMRLVRLAAVRGLAAEAGAVSRETMTARQFCRSGGEPPERTVPKRAAARQLRTDRTTLYRWFPAGSPEKFRSPNGGSSGS